MKYVYLVYETNSEDGVSVIEVFSNEEQAKNKVDILSKNIFLVPFIMIVGQSLENLSTNYFSSILKRKERIFI